MQRALRLVASLASRLLLAGVCLAIAACATKRTEQPHYLWPDREPSPPPIVVRTASIESAAGETAAAAKAASSAGHGVLISSLYLLMFPVGPLITIVGIPMALKDAHSQYVNETRCIQRVKDKLGDVPAWVRSTFSETPVAQLVVEGARSLLRDGGPSIVPLQGAGSPEERSAQFDKLGKDLGAKTLVLADIRVLFGEATGSACDVKLAAQADVRVQPIGQPEMKEPGFSVWAEQPQVPLEEWASEPARARRQLDELLATLGRKLIESYSDRMGCSERRCDWVATERPPPIRAAPLWCLVDQNAATVRCDFLDEESCATSKPDQGYRCVLSGPY
ncbi:MAG TPA: hypothetical protein PLE54_17950 [Burkholderiaceae bacterium]|nr:hypothetical protein [Burkholderiaceae bacterium]